MVVCEKFFQILVMGLKLKSINTNILFVPYNDSEKIAMIVLWNKDQWNK